MKIYEFEGKQLLRQFGLPIPEGFYLGSLADLPQLIADRKLDRGVVKAQVMTGGRGKAGGVKVAANRDELTTYAANIMGMSIKGEKVRHLLIERPLAIARELYVSFILDRDRRAVLLIASPCGGMDIEETARVSPEKIIKIAIHSLAGFRGYQLDRVMRGLGLDAAHRPFLEKLYRAFCELDAEIVEINPLVVTATGELIACDAKVIVDDNACFRHPEFLKLYSYADADPIEKEATAKQLSYVELDGDIGCIVNGAGLAMATMDLLQQTGGAPANFLDIGGRATTEQIVNAFSFTLRNKGVNVIFVNIFGGIVRCDMVATGVVEAMQKLKVNKQIVVRLRGTNCELAREVVASYPNIHLEPDLDKAVALAVKMSREARS